MKFRQLHPEEDSPIDKLTKPFVDFTRTEASSGLLLMFSAIIALLWANSPWTAFYEQVWHRTLRFEIEGWFLTNMSLRHWINDGLMAVFFFQVGLEIKREVLMGELAGMRKAALPGAAALGGMLVPAGIYLALNWDAAGVKGWGIPMATDIAFSLGVLGLFGSRLPMTLKVFLTALAIVDDLGAVLVIAFFYTASVDWGALAVAAAVWTLMWLFGRYGGRAVLIFAVLGVVVWGATLKSGVHATIAGVALALAVPAGPEVHPPLERWAHSLHPWVSYVIMPLFAFANAGLVVDSGVLNSFQHPVALGVLLGLVVGKPLGIAIFSWITVRLGWAELLPSMRWSHVWGLGLLGGIGFTMSLFIGGLAFGAHGTAGPEDLLDVAKAGILSASLLAGVLGWLCLRASLKATPPPAQPALPADPPSGNSPA